MNYISSLWQEQLGSPLVRLLALPSSLVFLETSRRPGRCRQSRDGDATVQIAQQIVNAATCSLLFVSKSRPHPDSLDAGLELVLGANLVRSGCTEEELTQGQTSLASLRFSSGYSILHKSSLFVFISWLSSSGGCQKIV